MNKPQSSGTGMPPLVWGGGQVIWTLLTLGLSPSGISIS